MLGVGGRLCGRGITQCSVFVEENLCMEDVKQHKCTRIERERERHKELYLYKQKATVTNEQQPLQKVTKSLYIVTHLGQLPFILFT